MMMPFGKHKGQELTQVPTDYLCWALSTINFKGPTLEQSITDELTSRGLELAVKEIKTRRAVRDAHTLAQQQRFQLELERERQEQEQRDEQARLVREEHHAHQAAARQREYEEEERRHQRESELQEKLLEAALEEAELKRKAAALVLQSTQAQMGEARMRELLATHQDRLIRPKRNIKT